MTTSVCRKRRATSSKPAVWDLRLYVANHNPRSVLACTNLKDACEKYLSGHYRIDVVDVIEYPAIARIDQIVAIPTVVRRSPMPVRTAIGDLSNTARLVASLDLEGEFR